MGLRINTNVTSLVAQRNLVHNTGKLKTALERLSSGNRIVRAADDAAGLAISENLRADIRGSYQAERNANDGVSLIQAAEGGLTEMSNVLIRLKELSIQSASDTIGNTERGFTDLEFQSLLKEIDRIAGSTEFNGKKLLTGGDRRKIQIQVGTQDGPYDHLVYKPEDTTVNTASLGLEGSTIKTKEGALKNLSSVDTALGKINESRAKLGALQNRLRTTVNSIRMNIENLSESNSRIRDADVAVQASQLTKANILTSSGISVLAQANSAPKMALKLIG